MAVIVTDSLGNAYELTVGTDGTLQPTPAPPGSTGSPSNGLGVPIVLFDSLGNPWQLTVGTDGRAQTSPAPAGSTGPPLGGTIVLFDSAGKVWQLGVTNGGQNLFTNAGDPGPGRTGLRQMFDLAHRKSYYSRSDNEVWFAISNAASTLYLKVMKEYRAFWGVFDNTSLALIPNVEEYILPPQCGQMMRMRERASVTEGWRIMAPADLNSAPFSNSQFFSVTGDSGPSSELMYYGPYLDMAGALLGAQVQKIRVSPIPAEARFVELAYVAKFLNITGPTSPYIIPAEADGAVLYAAVASLLADNKDDPTLARAQQRENEIYFLNWVRQRQVQSNVVGVQPFIGDMD